LLCCGRNRWCWSHWSSQFKLVFSDVVWLLVHGFRELERSLRHLGIRLKGIARPRVGISSHSARAVHRGIDFEVTSHLIYRLTVFHSEVLQLSLARLILRLKLRETQLESKVKCEDTMKGQGQSHTSRRQMAVFASAVGDVVSSPFNPSSFSHDVLYSLIQRRRTTLIIPLGFTMSRCRSRFLLSRPSSTSPTTTPAFISNTHISAPQLWKNKDLMVDEIVIAVLD
jgi:hypothetical protein